MSVGARIALVDDRSTASNPCNLSVQPFRFASHFPIWPITLGVGLLATGAWTTAKPALWPLPAVFLVLNVLFWVRVRLRFRHGCVNPATVVSTSPFTLAVFTDLTTCGGNYPVIKIQPHPTPRGIRFSVGDKCATVAMYNGDGNAEHWENFDPILVDCATDNRSAIEQVRQSIPVEEWSGLEAGLKAIPKPVKFGLYPLSRPGP
ncbi:conserved hypothetical protein [Verrucomicrobia bacterium]|nr:conserved hypothetical protein [Verrucomicrobiota bacterium]